MKTRPYFYLLTILSITTIFCSCDSNKTVFSSSKNTQNNSTNYKIRTIAFYNLENLFDTVNDPNVYDEASPIMESKGDTAKIYVQKLDNMARVIAQIGSKKTKTAPAIIGVSEIENLRVLEDLVANKHLKKFNYGIVHYDSPDFRGIDVALLYQKRYFKPIHSKNYELKLANNKEGKKQTTRDQLLVSGYLDDELMHIIVNHWPSRRGGEKKSSIRREKGAALNVQIIKKLQEENPQAKIITMGDFNDDPTNNSFKKVLKSKGKKSEVKLGDIYNPMENMHERGLNTLGYRDNINLFDQILISSTLLDTDKTFEDYKMFKANIYNPRFLINKKGRYKGYPYRSFSYGNFTGGYSDHYPVYIYVIKEK